MQSLVAVIRESVLIIFFVIKIVDGMHEGRKQPANDGFAEEVVLRPVYAPADVDIVAAVRGQFNLDRAFALLQIQKITCAMSGTRQLVTQDRFLPFPGKEKICIT